MLTNPRRNHTRAVWALMLAAALIAFFIGVMEVRIGAGAEVMPMPPTAAEETSSRVLEECGALKTSYTAEQNGDLAFYIVFRDPAGEPFAVVMYEPQHPGGIAYVKVHAVVERLTVDDIREKYPHPCDILAARGKGKKA